ncbi:MAG: diaminopimelate epimerase [Flavobacteriaceae bacterium]|nr:diaminopimelate epimerase [Flavobacteriaceae bacterium]
MFIDFYKFEGAGNDFVMIDNRNLSFDKSNNKLVNKMCNRRFGIGADGLILLEKSEKTDFKMIYFNSDGSEGTMCGNGGRCLVAFAKLLNIIDKETVFEAIDGLHTATIDEEMVKLGMVCVENIEINENNCFLDTGSPHHIEMVSELQNIDIVSLGRDIRNSKKYNPDGVNVNFVEQKNDNSFVIRTYERGVEDETLACGTGATAVAIAMYELGKTKSKTVNIEVKGGELQISFEKNKNKYKKVFLKGPAKCTYNGKYRI